MSGRGGAVLAPGYFRTVTFRLFQIPQKAQIPRIFFVANAAKSDSSNEYTNFSGMNSLLLQVTQSRCKGHR